MKDAYYFSHDGNARNDEKILSLRAEYGWEGYGIYWLLIEMMFENAETSLKHRSLKAIALANNVDITLLSNVINTAISEGLFVSDGDLFWSESLRRRKTVMADARAKKSEAGKRGMASRWGKPEEPAPQPDNKPDNDVIASKAKESKKSKKSKVVEPAFIEAVVAYLNEKAEKDFKPKTAKTAELITARAKEGFELEDFQQVIDFKSAEWKDDKKMQQFLRPETLFCGHFEGYLQAAKAGSQKLGGVWDSYKKND